MVVVLIYLFILLFPFLAFAIFYGWGLVAALVVIVACNVAFSALAVVSLTSLWPNRWRALA